MNRVTTNKSHYQRGNRVTTNLSIACTRRFLGKHFFGPLQQADLSKAGVCGQHQRQHRRHWIGQLGQREIINPGIRACLQNRGIDCVTEWSVRQITEVQPTSVQVFAGSAT